LQERASILTYIACLVL